MTPKILAILPKLSPTAEIYTIRPLEALEKQGKLKFYVNLESELNPQDIRGMDIVIFVRNAEKKYDDLLEEACAHDIYTIYDLDDNLWDIPENSPSKAYHQRDAMLQREIYLRSVNLVKVYNPIVADKVIENFNRSVYLALAGIDTTFAPTDPIANHNGPIKIVYATARGARDPLYSLFISDLMKILEDFRNKVEFITWNSCPDELTHFPNVKVLPVEENYQKFMRAFCHAGYDIGLAPAENSSFYNAKTNTKFRDYGLARIAGIYSNTPIYQGVKDRINGMLVDNSIGSWYETLSKLIRDEKLRESLRSTAFTDVVENYRQELMEAQWDEIIRNVVTRKSSNNNHTSRIQWAKISGGKIGGNGSTVITRAGSQEQQIHQISDPLPFENDSLDELIFVESLETAKNLLDVMREIYRVCKHGSTFTFVARYGSNHVTQADPNVHQAINEHTPRFWTSFYHSNVYEKNYLIDKLEPWGKLSQEGIDIDIRCQKLVFLYSSDYQNLSAKEQRIARKKYINVCDMIIGHCEIVKGKERLPTGTIMTKLFTEPQEVTIRRLEEQLKQVQKEVNDLQLLVREKEEGLQFWKNQPYKIKAESLLREITVIRSHWIVRNLYNLLDKFDYSQYLSPNFNKLLQDSLVLHKTINGYLLKPSDNLQELPFVEYPIIFPKSKLNSLEIALKAPLPVVIGKIGIELVNPLGQIAIQTSRNLEQVNDAFPVVFPFDSIQDSNIGKFLLRIFAREANQPIYVLEYQKNSLSSLIKKQRLPFIGFTFDEQ